MTEVKHTGGGTGLAEQVEQRLQAFRQWLEEKWGEQVEELRRPEETQLYRAFFRVGRTDDAIALCTRSTICSCTSIRSRSTAMPCATATRGGWAASAFICSWCCCSRACC